MVEALHGESILRMAELTTLARWKERLLGCGEILSMYVNVRFCLCLERLCLDFIYVREREILFMFGEIFCLCLERYVFVKY